MEPCISISWAIFASKRQVIILQYVVVVVIVGKLFLENKSMQLHTYYVCNMTMLHPIAWKSLCSRSGHGSGFPLRNTDCMGTPEHIYEASPLEMSEFVETREKYREVHKTPVDAR